MGVSSAHACAVVNPLSGDGPVNADPGPGRAAQRRRTRAAIVAATARLLGAGADPSMADIAAAADVSRRTIYTYFSTLDHLLLDATLGALSTDVEAEIAATDADGADGPKAPLDRAQTRLPAGAVDGGRAGPVAGHARPGALRGPGVGAGHAVGVGGVHRADRPPRAGPGPGPGRHRAGVPGPDPGRDQ